MMHEMKDTAKRMHFTASGVIGPILVILGMVGNILSILVWSRGSMKGSTGRYLICLVS